MKKLLLSALLTAIAGCSALPGLGTQAPATDFDASANAQRRLYVLPEAGNAPVVQAIAAAKSSIRMHMYLITTGGLAGEVVQALIDKARTGVEVRILLDGTKSGAPRPPACEPPADPPRMNQASYDLLTAGGVNVKWSDPRFRFTHQKSMLIDGQTAWIMTTNISSSAFKVNREYLVADRDKRHVSELAKMFEADWTGAPFTPTDPDMVVSPSNSRAKILGLIDSATRDLVLQVEYMSDPEVVAHLAARVKAGVTVTAMLSYAEKPNGQGCSNRDVNADEAKQLAEAGVTRVAFLQSVKLHAKAVVVDHARAFIGSENFTTNSLNNNRELGIILRDPALVSELEAVMTKDWAAKTARISQGASNATDADFGFAAAFGL